MVASKFAAAQRGLRAAWPKGAPGYALLALLLIGAVLRLIAIISWWPTTTLLTDGYERFTSNPFVNTLHPGGYSLIIAALGLVTREIAAPILLQHLCGFASALLLWAATRRLTGSDWAGLLPAGIVLLDPDFIYLEHSIMSETWLVLAISAGLYAAVRALDEPKPYWRWPLLTGVALSLSVTIRTAGLFLIPVAVVVLVIYRPWSSEDHGMYRRAALAVVGASAVVLLAFATANATFGDRFGLGASPGWYLYARVAKFADCSKFTPPAGTGALCEDRPASQRPGTQYYLLNPDSPAHSQFGPIGSHDAQLRDWALRAIVAQPGDYLRDAWDYLRGYWFPDLRPTQTGPAGGLDPQLAFTNGLDDSGFYSKIEIGAIESAFQRNLEHFYNDFTVHKSRPGLEFLRVWQRVVRFGATALSIATLLVLLGLAIGTRRSRTGVILFGIGGLTMILIPALTANYYGRYTVPMAGPLMAAAAITIVEIWRTLKARRTRRDASGAGGSISGAA